MTTAKEKIEKRDADLDTFSILDENYRRNKTKRYNLERAIERCSDELKKDGQSEASRKSWQEGLDRLKLKLAKMPSQENIATMKSHCDIVRQRINLANKRGHSTFYLRKQIRNMIKDKEGEEGKPIPERTFQNYEKGPWKNNFVSDKEHGNMLAIVNGTLLGMVTYFRAHKKKNIIGNKPA